MEKVVLLGAGGHCKVVIDILRDNYIIAGITDVDREKHGTLFYGFPVLGDDSQLGRLYHEGVENALATLGSTRDSSLRRKLYELAAQNGFRMINAISKYSIISLSARFGNGNVVMDSAIIHADVSVGSNCIINTGAIIEHDCVIGNHVHISPGTKIAGGVRIGNGVHIGIGASIIQNISIGDNCVIGAGSVVIRNIPEGSVVAGVPAVDIRKDSI